MFELNNQPVGTPRKVLRDLHDCDVSYRQSQMSCEKRAKSIVE